LSRIVVTGMGVISAIGNNTAENHQALKLGHSGIGRLQVFQSKYAGKLPAGEVKITTEELQKKLDATEPGVTRTSLLALHAFKEAVKDSGITAGELKENGTALICGTTVGGMCLTDQLYHDANESTSGSAYLNSYDSASVSLYLQNKFGIGGIINTINTACSSSANAIMYGALLIKHGMAKKAIVGGADSLAKFTINGFNALFILSNEACAPFDKERKGLNLGEGAAFLVLEKEEDTAGKKTYASVSGYGNSNDAFHPSSLSVEGNGPFLSMENALNTAMLNAAQIDFINAHGTGTENNDLAESNAIVRLFKKPPPFVSTKSATGHTLGAAGAVEAAFSILSLQHQEVYAALNFKQPIEETGLVPVQQYRSMALNHIMSNSFGFGGNCTSLIFSKV
jgi:3-oxoacyl-(acyl-carrier-protein) synthase